MNRRVGFTITQAALCGFCCWMFADGPFSTFAEWSGVGAAFFALGGLMWSLVACANWGAGDSVPHG